MCPMVHMEAWLNKVDEIAAVGAGGGGGGLLADQLRTAGGAVVGAHLRRVLAPVRAECRRPGFFCRLCGPLFFRLASGLRGGRLFFGVQRLDLRHFKGAAAVFTFQLAGAAVKVERPRACRTLIVGDLSCHGCFHFLFGYGNRPAVSCLSGLIRLPRLRSIHSSRRRRAWWWRRTRGR